MSVYAKPLRLCSFILLATLCLDASAQSGRAVPTSQPAPTRLDATSNQPGDASRFVAAANADEYRLVFPTVSEGKGLYRLDKKKDRGELARADQSEYKNFVEQLNQLGAQGYKLVSTTYTVFPIGVVKLGNVQYEYDWFETDGSVSFPLAGFEGDYAQRSRRGFRFADHLVVFTYCEDVDRDNSAAGQWCEARHLFLMMREKGVEKPGRYFLVKPTRDWRGARGDDFANQIKGKLAEGFNSINALSEEEILLEQTPEDEPLTGSADVRVVQGKTWVNGDHLSERVNALAKQGYRLALVNNRIAIMYRSGDAATPFKYVWLKATSLKNWKLELRYRKGFEEQLAKLQTGGAVYRAAYDPDLENELVFELRPGGDGRRREYQTLMLDFDVQKNVAEQRVTFALAPSGVEALKTINRLAKEGFKVRDLFASPVASVLLERVQ